MILMEVSAIFAPLGLFGITGRLLLGGKHILQEGKMEEIGVQGRREYGVATVAVIRGVTITDRTMRYNELARVIGLLPEGAPWHIRYRTYITDILSIAAAVENQTGPNTGGSEPLEFHLILNEDGEPACGFFKKSPGRSGGCCSLCTQPTRHHTRE